MPDLRYYYRIILNYPKLSALIISVLFSIYKFVYVKTTTLGCLKCYGSAGDCIHVKVTK